MLEASIETILPEVVLALYAMGGLMLAVYTSKDGMAKTLTWTTIVVFGIVAVWVGLSDEPPRTGFGGMFVDDAFARFAKVAILLSAAAVLAMSVEYMERRDLLRFEYPVLVTLAVVGMMVMVSAGDFMTLYMGLELQSLALYVVAALRRDQREVDRGRAEVLRPGRPLLWPDALWDQPDLRVRRHDALRRLCSPPRWSRCRSGCCSASSS